MPFTNEDLKQRKEWLEEYPLVLNLLPMIIKDKALVARLEAAEALVEYACHPRECIRTYWEAGEPTSDGGYRTKFKGVWYQSKPVNEEPKCDCGLDDAEEAWRKECGK